MGNEENYDRALWQSARTKNGKVASLPASYEVAWELANTENMLRNLATQIRRHYNQGSSQ